MEGEEEDEELWLLKRPINICQFVTSPFFEAEERRLGTLASKKADLIFG